ncbi:replication initiation protein [Helicobacter pylori]|nr:replication initiation protein [Helicobacter pylori]
MAENKAFNFRFHNDLNMVPLSFLNTVEYNYLICLLYAIRNKGDAVVELSVASHRSIVAKKYLNYRYKQCMIGLRDKLEKHGMIGRDKALFSCFEMLIKNGKIKSIKIQISKDSSYLINNITKSYTTINLNAFQHLSTFTSKALYCLICRNKNKSSFWVRVDLAKSCLGINIHSTTADVLKIKNAIKSLKSIGIDLLVTKNKNINDRRSVFSLNFAYDKADDTKQKQADTATPPTIQATNNHTLDSLINLTYKKDDKLVRLSRIDKNGAYYKAWFETIDKQGCFFVNIKNYAYFMDYLAVNGFIKQDKSMISEVKTNQADTPTPFKENDAIIRFKNRAETLNKDKANPTIAPTTKNANNKPIQSNNETLNKFENIVLTSPKYFDYVIKSVTKGSLYYEIKAYCDLKKKHELIKLPVAEYSNPLDYFYKQGYKFKRYDKQESDAGFEKYIHKIASLTHSDELHGGITSYLKIMRIFKRYDDKIQVELKDVDKEGVVIKPFIACNEKHLSSWFNKHQFGSY